MKPLLLFAGLLLVGGPGAAQTAPVAAPSALPAVGLAAAPAAPDTAAALHRLFAGRRQRRTAIALGLGAGLVLNGVDAALTADDEAAGRPPILNLGSAPGTQAAPRGGTPVATTWLVALLPSAGLIALDYLAYAGFSRKQEARAIEACRAGKLPLRLRKKLRGKHFRPASAR